MNMKLLPPPIAVAVAGCFSVTAFAAPLVVTNGTDISTVLNGKDPTGTEISFEFNSTIASESQAITLNGNNKTWTFKSTGSVIKDDGAKNVNFWLRDFKSLTLQSTDGSTISYIDRGGQMIVGGYQDLTQNNSPELADTNPPESLTIASTNGHAVYIKGLLKETNGSEDRSIQIAFNSFAKNTDIKTQSTMKAAIFVTGEFNANESLMTGEASFKVLDLGEIEQKMTVFAPKEGTAIYAENFSGAELHVDRFEAEGNIELVNGAWMDIGWKAGTLPPAWNDDTDDLLDESVAKRRIQVTSNHAEKATLHIEKGSLLSMAAKNVFITQENKDGKAMFIDLSSSNTYYELPTVVALWADNALHIKGDIVIDNTQADSQSLINLAAGSNIQIKGDVRIENQLAADGKTSATKNSLVFSLTGEESVFEGTINDVYLPASKAKIKMRSGSLGNDVKDAGTRIVLKDGAKMTLTGDSTISGVESDGGEIDVSGANLTLKSLTNKGQTTVKTQSVKANQINVENVENDDDGILTVNIASADGVQNPDDVQNIVNFTDGQSQKFSAMINESGSSTEQNFVFDDNGNLTSSSVNNNTSVTEAAADISGLQVLAWRAQMNDVQKRLGDLRTYPSSTGAWVRLYGGEEKYGNRNLKNKHNTIQIGVDTRVGSNFYVGATASYTEGDGKMINGTSDDKSFSFGLYGGWLGDDGQFVDVIVKQAKMDSEFDLSYKSGQSSSGDFDMWGTSVSMQYGWRINCAATNFWIEPDVEFAYGYMQSTDYQMSDGVTVKQGAIKSAIARAGLSIGRTFEKGAAYVKASVAHDFDGEATTMASNGLKPVTEDLGGTWGEVAIGATLHINGGFYAYGEAQTAFGSPIDAPYKWNVGARYVW